MSLFDQMSEGVSDLPAKLLAQVPDAVYQQATQAKLVDTAIAAIVRHAAQGVAASLMPQASGGAGSLLGSLSGSLGGLGGMLEKAQNLGLGALLQKALDSTDLDERLRDSVVDGLTRYLRDHAGELAKVALNALMQPR